MKPQSRLVFFTFITLLVLVANLVMPTAALADDGVPPEAPTEEAPPPETPPVDEAPPPEAPVSLPEVLEQAPTPEAPPSLPEVLEQVPPPEVPVDLPTVLEQAPPDTQVVVVNDAGQIEPLATVEAAEILATGDPVWCPSSVGAPTPGLNGCTPGYTTMAALATELGTGTYTGAGTIWVESSYAGNDDSEIILDHSSMSGLTDLIVQGGWNGVSGNNTIGVAPVFDVALNIVNWVGNVTLNNLFIDADDTYAALVVDTLGDITMDDMTVTGNATGTGASLDSCQYGSVDPGLCAGTGNVTVTDSTFSGNNYIGLSVDSGGDSALSNVTADGNLGPDGVFVIGEDDSGTPHNMTVNGGSFSNNGNGSGLDILSDGNIELYGVTADNNNTGALLDTTAGTGAILVDGGQFNNNDWYGLAVDSAGDITVQNNAEFDSNSFPGHDTYGAYLNATYGTGAISVSDSTFTGNDGYGVFGIANGNVTLDNVTVDGYDSVSGSNVTDNGAWIKSIDGAATVNGGVFTNNTKVGLIAIGGLQVSLVNVDVTLNAGDGAQAYSTFTYACFGSNGIPVSVNGGIYSGNGGAGLRIKPGPDGTVTVVVTPDYTSAGANGDGDLVIDLGNPCLDKEEPEESKPVNVVEVPFKGGDPVPQECTTYSGTVLVLPDGTRVKFGCPFDGSVSLEGLTEDELPGPLGAGTQFVSAIVSSMTDLQGVEILVNPDGTITLKFKIPEDSNARAYDILYWDPSANGGTGAWVTLPKYKFGQPQAVSLHPEDPEDGRLITRGVKQHGNYVMVTVNFTGTFVLVAR